MLVQGEKMSATIPQLDGPTPDPYDDALSTPNVSSSPYLFAIGKGLTY